MRTRIYSLISALLLLFPSAVIAQVQPLQDGSTKVESKSIPDVNALLQSGKPYNDQRAPILGTCDVFGGRSNVDLPFSLVVGTPYHMIWGVAAKPSDNKWPVEQLKIGDLAVSGSKVRPSVWANISPRFQPAAYPVAGRSGIGDTDLYEGAVIIISLCERGAQVTVFPRRRSGGDPGGFSLAIITDSKPRAFHEGNYIVVK